MNCFCYKCVKESRCLPCRLKWKVNGGKWEMCCVQKAVSIQANLAQFRREVLNLTEKQLSLARQARDKKRKKIKDLKQRVSSAEARLVEQKEHYELLQKQTTIQQKLDVAKSHLANSEFYNQLPVEYKLPETNKTE